MSLRVGDNVVKLGLIYTGVICRCDLHKSEYARSETYRRIEEWTLMTLSWETQVRVDEVIAAQWQPPISLTGTPRRAPAS